MRLLLLCFIFLASLFGREIVDMAGRKVTVPEKITRVFGSAPPSTYAVYAIDPSLVVGLNFSPAKGSNEASGLLDKKFVSLPIVGGLQGGIQGINRESLLSVKPEVILAWKNDASAKLAEEAMSQSKIPTVYLDLEKIENIPASLTFLGELLGKKERAATLVRYANSAIAKTKSTLSKYPAAKRPIVYYAEGADGLATECEDSSHYAAIKFAGGINPHKCKSKNGMGMDKISMEQVISYNPDIIIVQEKIFFDSVKSDPKWKNIKAVKNGEIYLVPKVPFNWVDRPPSFMRLLGVQWLQSVILKTGNKEELKKEVKAFYKLFLNVEPSDAQTAAFVGTK
ncbi:MAG: ABC transporter substrate-binding protein [Campylobacterales bacterium]